METVDPGFAVRDTETSSVSTRASGWSRVQKTSALRPSALHSASVLAARSIDHRADFETTSLDHSTHAHSALAVAAEASRWNATSSEALRARRIIASPPRRCAVPPSGQQADQQTNVDSPMPTRKMSHEASQDNRHQMLRNAIGPP